MHTTPLRFGIVADGPEADEAFVDLAAAVLRARGPLLEPLFFASYAGLLEACQLGRCDAVWAPPLVARELRFTELREPAAIVVREAGAFYYSALVVKKDRRGRAAGLHELAGARIAWVSPRSAAGYVVPYLQLRALGYEPERWFGEARFHYTHARALAALDRGEADVAATYAHVGADGRFRVRHVADAHIVLTAGPIPGDVILTTPTARGLGASLLRAALREEGALTRVTGARRFDPAPERHFTAIERWSGLASAIGLGPARAVAHEATSAT
jgi:ABC-type phosphate/phosphonate transport system substrate-binding protein